MADGGDLEIQIEPLGQEHVREAFDCGHAGINSFCRTSALDEHVTYAARVFVGVEPNSKHVLGFYSLAMKHLKSGKRPGYVPAIYLPMLAVCTEHQGKRIGARLIQDAFKRSILVSEEVGAQFLWLDAVDEPTVSYYESLGFIRLKKKPGWLEMSISLEPLRLAAAAAAAAEQG